MKTLLPALPIVLAGLVILVVPLVYPLKPPKSSVVNTVDSALKIEPDALEGHEIAPELLPKPAEPGRQLDTPEAKESELHSTVVFTLNTYAHVIEGTDQDGARETGTALQAPPAREEKSAR